MYNIPRCFHIYYISTHFLTSQPTLIKLDNENIGGHLTPLQAPMHKTAFALAYGGLTTADWNYKQNWSKFHKMIIKKKLSCRRKPHDAPRYLKFYYVKKHKQIPNPRFKNIRVIIHFLINYLLP